jgi:hypothetical protein
MTVLRALASVPHQLMSDKPGKAKKPKKTAAAQPSVLASLPATRPDRLGRRTTASATGPAATRTAKPAATAPAKPKPRATRSKAASRAPTAEKAAAAQRRAARPAPSPPPPPKARPRRSSSPPSGPELVTTAIQAAGEIAHIGITVGGQVLKRAARRIPRP